MGRGENEGVYLLAEVVCEAIPDPSLDVTSDEWKKKIESRGQAGKHASGRSVDVILPEAESEGKQPPQKSAD